MTDAEIIDGLFRRDDDVLAGLQEKYGPYCTAITENILGNREAAEEVCSDVWMRVWENIPPVRPDNLRVYVGRIARNAALHRLEWENAGKRSGIRVQLDELHECLPYRMSGVDVDRLALQEIMSRFIRDLSGEKRVIFIRRYWYGDSVEQIARMCGCKPVRITGILYRVRKQLRKILEKEEIGL